MSLHGRPSIAARIADLTSRQHGVVTRAQLEKAGLTSAMVDRRVRTRELRPLHRGVYLHGALVGRLEPARARQMAAVLACRSGAVVSHESAAALWELLREDSNGAPVHVTIPGADRGRRPGIHPHRVAMLPGKDATVVDGIPVTAPARTLVDLAGRVGPRVLEQAFAEVERRELAGSAEVAAVLARRSRAHGSPLLQKLIEARAGPAFTRSAAEERLLALIRKGDLPIPETNVQVAGNEVDFLWRSAGVVVDVDGFAHHSSRRKFESDRRRDARLAALGLRTVRVTWRQLANEPHAVLVRLAQVLVLARAE